jgi:hypothetical protein
MTMKIRRLLFKLRLMPMMLLSAPVAYAAEVNLTADLPYLDIEYEGRQVRIERIQDTENRLDNSFTKTSRPCPPFCIGPMQAAVGVTTVGELELFNFLIEKVRTGNGLLIDSRLPEWFQKGTIPGSVNIPWTLLVKGPDNPHTARILRALGAKESTLTNCATRSRTQSSFGPPLVTERPRMILALDNRQQNRSLQLTRSNPVIRCGRSLKTC